MASGPISSWLLARWTWVWVNSGSWWWTGRHGVLRFMGSQRVGHDWATELNWTELLAKKQVGKNCQSMRIFYWLAKIKKNLPKRWNSVCQKWIFTMNFEINPWWQDFFLECKQNSDFKNIIFNAKIIGNENIKAFQAITRVLIIRRF